MSCAGHPLVRTPHLDHLAEEGVRLARHYSQCSPCGPGRASLYTGLYQMNHRVVANGTPLDARFDNIAKVARRAGYRPILFGYTDQAIDPRVTEGPRDPRLLSYEAVLPGFEVGCHLPMGNPAPWTDWLRLLGHTISDDPHAVLETEPARPAEHSMAAFLTDRFLDWLDARQGPWFAHVSHLRPHSPYAAAGHFAKLYDPAAVDLPIPPSAHRHPLHQALLANPRLAAPTDEHTIRQLRAQYFGMASEVDFQLGRVWDALKRSGQWGDTFIVVTSDHGEQLGDHGLLQKYGFFEQSFHIPGIVRDPRATGSHGAVIDAFTENVDLFPTLCDAMGVSVPAQCDGLPLTPFLKGEVPPLWREAAHWEFDWQGSLIPHGPHDWPWDRRLERQNLAALRTRDGAYVHFGDGSAVAFDLGADPSWRTEITDPARVLDLAQAMLTWRARHTDRTLTGMLIENGGIGRWPEMPEGWGNN
jgi:arylsulfatase A-like enzyme